MAASDDVKVSCGVPIELPGAIFGISEFRDAQGIAGSSVHLIVRQSVIVFFFLLFLFLFFFLLLLFFFFFFPAKDPPL